MSCYEFCKRLAGEDPQRCIIFSRFPGDQHVTHLLVPLLHIQGCEGTKRFWLNAPLVIKPDFPIMHKMDIQSFLALAVWGDSQTLLWCRAMYPLLSSSFIPDWCLKIRLWRQYFSDEIMYVFCIFHLYLTYSSKYWFVKWKKNHQAPKPYALFFSPLLVHE